MVKRIYNNKSDILEAFGNNPDDDQLFEGGVLEIFLGLQKKKDGLKGKQYFLGVNVRTSIKESVKPIQIKNNINYVSPDKHNIRNIIPGSIDQLLQKIREQTPKFTGVTFMWETTTNNIHDGIVKVSSVEFDDGIRNSKTLKNEISAFFNGIKGSYEIEGLNGVEKKSGYHVIGHVVANSVWKENIRPLYIWISTVDYDIRNEAKPLSFILAICESKDDLNVVKKKKVEIYNYIMLVKAGYLKKIEDDKSREAVKSAKAAIMSRNMSHNLGSHVMFYVKQKLESVEKILQTGALKELVQSSSLDEIKEKLKDEGVSLGTEMPFLVGLGRFLSYLQERQDYIATVATDYIPYPSVVNFKDAIYDELKPDLRCKRHSGEAIGRKASNLLLDYIAYSEGFTKSEKIVLQFHDQFRGEGVVPDDLRKMNVALPGGTLGRQAFFSIMENIIRNTAKHDGGKVGDSPLVFRFDIIKANSLTPTTDSTFAYTGDEKLEKSNVEKAYKECDDDFYYLGIMVVINQDASKTIELIGEALKRKYIREDGQMDDSCKGIKEIRLSSAWIRGKALDTDISEKEPPAVSVRIQNGNIQYIICLPKPKKVAFVVDDKRNFTNYISNFGLIKSKGCKIYDEKDIDCKEKNKEIADFDLIVVSNNISNKYYNKLRSFVGSRIFREDTKDLHEWIYNSDIGSVYRSWVRHAFGPKIPMVSILDRTSKEDKDGIQFGGTQSTDKKFFENCIVFNAHYFGQNSSIYTKNEKRCFSKALFVESISGGNSTDRLMRQESQTAEWYAKQVATGLTKVAVFDERIYNLVMPKGNYEISEVRAAVKKLGQFLFSHQENLLDCFYEQLLSDLHLEYKERGFYNYLSDLKSEWEKEKNNERCKWDWKSTSYFQKTSLEDRWMNLLSKYMAIKDYSTAWKYRETGIWAFNIVGGEHINEKGEKEKCAVVIGYNAPTSAKIFWYKEEYKERNIAKIYIKDGKICVDKTDFWPQSYKFDIITIHQGVLDKIYSILGIGKKETKKRIEVTNKLYKRFSKYRPVKISKDESFMPQLIIHSGRSKPNYEDMPQKQPFLQFSSLDNAVRDCKNTLTELLYSAHYE